MTDDYDRQRAACERCGKRFTPASTGRPAKYCSGTCRSLAYQRRRVEAEVRAEVQAEREAAFARSPNGAAAAERLRSSFVNRETGSVDHETPQPAAEPAAEEPATVRDAPNRLPPGPKILGISSGWQRALNGESDDNSL